MLNIRHGLPRPLEADNAPYQKSCEWTILDEGRLAVRLVVVNDSSLANLSGEESKLDLKIHLSLISTT